MSIAALVLGIFSFVISLIPIIGLVGIIPAITSIVLAIIDFFKNYYIIKLMEVFYMKFKVDKDVCIGCGACASICDEVFEIKDDGYAEASDKEITDEEVKENAISAMEGCPTNAIREVKDKEA